MVSVIDTQVHEASVRRQWNRISHLQQPLASRGARAHHSPCWREWRRTLVHGVLDKIERSPSPAIDRVGSKHEVE